MAKHYGSSRPVFAMRPSSRTSQTIFASLFFIEMWDLIAYMILNRTRQASIRQDMHTWRVFY